MEIFLKASCQFDSPVRPKNYLSWWIKMRFKSFEVRLRERRRHAPAHRCAPFYLCRRGAGRGELFITLCILIAREARGSRSCVSCSVPLATAREQLAVPCSGPGRTPPGGPAEPPPALSRASASPPGTGRLLSSRGGCGVKGKTRRARLVRGGSGLSRGPAPCDGSAASLVRRGSRRAPRPQS